MAVDQGQLNKHALLPRRGCASPLAAALLMGAGVYLHLTESHEHEHENYAFQSTYTPMFMTNTIGTNIGQMTQPANRMCTHIVIRA